MQYHPNVMRTIDFFADKGYALFVHWLNPGYEDGSAVNDKLKLMPYLLKRKAFIAVRNGKSNPAKRVRELNDIIYGWAKTRNLILTKW